MLQTPLVLESLWKTSARAYLKLVDQDSNGIQLICLILRVHNYFSSGYVNFQLAMKAIVSV